MPGLFICYEKVKDGLAKITNTCTVVDHDSYAAQLSAQGIKFYFAPMDGFTGYFELDANDDVVAMDVRPDFGRTFDKTELGILEVATLLAVPACDVHVDGPRTSSVIKHPGGDLQVRFALPGTYTVWFEAFPAKQLTTAITVSAKPVGSN